MSKKVISLCLVMAGVLNLVACGKAPTNEVKTEGKAEGKTLQETGQKLTGELEMIFWDSNQEKGLIAMAEGFMEQNPGVKISVETIPWNEYWMKLQASATGGNMPDVVVMHPDEVTKYVEGNMLMDLTDMYAKSSITGVDKFPESAIGSFYIDGKYYGIPKDIGTMALCYNKDLFDAAGVAYPTSDWTWDDMMAAAEKITDTSKDIYGIAAPNNGQNFYWNLMWQNGGDFFNEDGSSAMDSPEVIDALKYAVSFIEKGYSPTAADFANLTADEYFQAGKVGMVFAGSWMLPQYLDTEGLNFDVAELPTGKEKGALSSSMAFSVSASTKNPEAAVAFAEYLGSEEGQKLQATTGVAIPAYNNTQQPWIDQYTTIDASAYAKAAEYGRTSPGITTNTEYGLITDKYVPEIFSLSIPVEQGCKEMAEKINALGLNK